MLEVAHDDRQKRMRSIGDVLHEETDKLHLLSVAKTPLTGTPSGFKDIDEKTGGFQPGNLIVIAARPSMGKSALVANIAENAALEGRPVVLFSLEMSESELAQRFVASQARIKGDDLRRGKVAEAALAEDPRGLPAAGAGAAVRRRLQRHRRDRDPSQGPPPAQPGRRRARAGDRRLPAADAPRGLHGEPRRAGRRRCPAG